MKFIDLFCGVGGFHQALRRLGHTCVLACDIDKQCRLVYEDNYGIKPCEDVCSIDTDDIEDFDILTAGFPCQPFSNGGSKKAFNDRRGNLFLEIIRIASAKKPRFMFLENVKHIKKISGGQVFDSILAHLDKTGYKVQVEELSPHQLGVPQQRERVIFICVRKDIYCGENVIISLQNDVQCDFSKFFEDDNVDKKYKISADVEAVLSAWDEMIKIMDVGQKMSPMILADELRTEYTEDSIGDLPAWKRDCIMKNRTIYKLYKKKWDPWLDKYESVLSKRQIYSQLDWQAGPLEENDSIFNHFIQIRQSGIRVKKTKYFPTLVAIVQTPIYGKERRYLTPRECARLQSFPDDFVLHSDDKVAYKQFGNAVNVEVVYTIMNSTLQLYA